MAKRLVLLVCVAAVAGMVAPRMTLGDTIIKAVQSSRSTITGPDTNTHDSSKLSVRSDASSNKSWIKFELGDIEASSLKSATLTVTLHNPKTGARNFDVSYVNDNCLDNIGWTERTLTWNNAPGNNTADQARLDLNRTTLVGTVKFTDGVAGQSFTIDVLDALQTDTDGIAQFVLHNSNGLLDFATHDHATEAYRPFLDVTVGSGAQARRPSPVDGDPEVYCKSILSWTAGKFAVAHDVYLGTDMNDVNNAGRTSPLGVLVSQGQPENRYTPDRLDFGRTYYWRVDEVNAAPDSTLYKGQVWSFTVEPLARAIAGTGITAAASSSMAGASPANTINGSGLTGDLHSTDDTAMWLTANTATDPAWIKYEFDRLYKLHEMWVWNYNSAVEPGVGFGMNEVTIEYSADGTTWTKLGNTAFAQGPGAAGYAHDTTVSFSGAVARSVQLKAASNYGGSCTGLSEVRFLSIPVVARHPQPASAATGVDPAATLTWWVGREAVSHKVFLGTDKATVGDGTAGSAVVTESSYTPRPLMLDTPYYWRVDEIGATTTYPGDVWSFSTSPFLPVDDFESYNDGCNRVFFAWVDGFGYSASPDCKIAASSGNGTGSTVGNTNPPFAGTTVVHSGRQSMPLAYDNSGGKPSEAIRTFAAAQDWTASGIKSLSLWFCGAADNTGQLYVKINDIKVLCNGSAADIAGPQWQSWSIDLSTLGADLRHVTSLTIGIDGAGAKGSLSIDDIRLYPKMP